MGKIRKFVESLSKIKGEPCNICGSYHTNTHMPYCSNSCVSDAIKRIPRNPEFNDKFHQHSTEYVRDVLGLMETLQTAPCAHCGRHTNFIHLRSKQFMCGPTCIDTFNSMAKMPYTDPYLHNDVNISRLINEYYKYGRLIVAFDYDSTVHDYHNTGSSYIKVKELLIKAKKVGCYLIVYTCSSEDRYPEIRKYLQECNVPFDAINTNCPDITFAENKLYYNILLDDRAGLASAYANLDLAIDAIIQTNKENYEKHVKDLQEHWIKGAGTPDGDNL